MSNPPAVTNATFSCSGSSGGGVVYVFSGTATGATAFEGTGPVGAQNSATPGAITPSQTGDVFVSVVTDGQDTYIPWSTPSGWTSSQSNQNNGALPQFSSAYFIDSGVSAVNPSWGYPGNAQTVSQLAIKPASGNGTLAAPTFSAGTGTYNNNQSITITPPTGATACYTTNGDTPTAATAGTCDSDGGNEHAYSTPVAISATGTVLKAIATQATWTNSSVTSATYTLQVATPSDTPGAGSYASAQTITISDATTSVAVNFCYTVDGSTPTGNAVTCTHGTHYTAPFTSPSTTFTLKVVGYGTGYAASTEKDDTYTILSAAATPTFSPVAGTYNAAQSVTISTASSGCGSYIYWSPTHNPPTTADTQSTTASVAISETLYAKVIGCPGYSDSSVGSAAYVIIQPPTFSPVAGTYGTAQTVTISDSTAGATISYCASASACSPSLTYSTPIAVSSSEYLCANATVSGVTGGTACAQYAIVLGGMVWR